jgi:hypothetical protein
MKAWLDDNFERLASTAARLYRDLLDGRDCEFILLGQ